LIVGCDSSRKADQDEGASSLGLLPVRFVKKEGYCGGGGGGRVWGERVMSEGGGGKNLPLQRREDESEKDALEMLLTLGTFLVLARNEVHTLTGVFKKKAGP